MLVNLLHNRLFPTMRVLFMPSSYFSTESVNEPRQKTNKKEIIERTITEEDVNLFSKITGDSNVIHFNSYEKRGVVHGALLNGIVSGVIGTKLPGNGTIVLSQTLNFPNPCFIGDTVLVSVEIENLRKISSCKYEIVNKLSKLVVMNGTAKLLIKNGS